MTLQKGYYSAKWSPASEPEIVRIVKTIDTVEVFRIGSYGVHSTDQFYWISETPIVPEEPKIKLNHGDWYMVRTPKGVYMCQYYSDTASFYVGNDAWLRNRVEVLSGPFNTEELMSRKAI
jgi:hypothetical protein